MTNEKDPAIMPGDGARAIDTIRDDSNTNGRWAQAIESMKRRILEPQLDYSTEFMCCVAWLAGYEPDMPIGVAHDAIKAELKARFHIK